MRTGAVLDGEKTAPRRADGNDGIDEGRTSHRLHDDRQVHSIPATTKAFLGTQGITYASMKPDGRVYQMARPWSASQSCGQVRHEPVLNYFALSPRQIVARSRVLPDAGETHAGQHRGLS